MGNGSAGEAGACSATVTGGARLRPGEQFADFLGSRRDNQPSAVPRYPDASSRYEEGTSRSRPPESPA